MNEKIFPDFSGLGSLLESCQVNQKKFVPSGQIMTAYADAFRTISQAQMAYGQSVMRANAALMAAVWEAYGGVAGRKSETEERPSTTARQSDVQAP